tara:strand:+ start:29833 stop:30696 length:864 start_codon:yes stop_codon:yes gene_type:complete
MPELPEVEIIKQSLKKKINNMTILKVKINNSNLRFKLQKNFIEKVRNRKVINVNRIAKYLIISLDNNSYVLIHFGMSGTLHLKKKFEKKSITNLSFYHSLSLPKKHNHVELIFRNFKIIYNDPRRFGFFKYFARGEELNNYLNRIGLDPLNKNFNYNYLKKRIMLKNKNIKNILLDQKILSGIGNIYANEILFKSKINPNKAGKKISTKELKKIEKNSKKILRDAILKGGSSIRDFKNSDGKIGFYQNEFKVYNRENRKCLNQSCKLKINKIFMSNRSTFYCKNCQK